VLKNGVALTIEIDDRGQFTFNIGVCLRLAVNGKFHEDADELSLKSVKTSVKIKGDDGDYEEGFDTRLADSAVEAIVARMEKLDAFIGSLPKAISLIGSQEMDRLSEKDLDSFTDRIVGYESDSAYLTLKIRTRGKTDYLSVDFAVKDAITDGGIVKSIGSTPFLVKVNSIKSFNQIIAQVEKHLKKIGVKEIGTRVFTYKFTGNDEKKIPLSDRTAFERELKTLLNKHKLTLSKPVKK
jgi:hypothetical protein